MSVIMDNCKKARSVTRSLFSKCCKKLDSELRSEQPNLSIISTTYQLLTNKISELSIKDKEIYECMLADNEMDEIELEEEQSVSDDYLIKFYTLKDVVEKVLSSSKTALITSTTTQDHSKGQSKQITKQYPKIELPKFSGHPKEWITFWSSFKSIHDDADLPLEEKFQYLLQCAVPKSRVCEVLKGYPPSGNNYLKAVEALKRRFGRKELLVEVYVRELLNILLKSSKGMSLSELYDNLESHVNALESLEVDIDACAPLIYPLVESCVPSDLLAIWERQQRTTTTPDGESVNSYEERDRVRKLLNFLRDEVESSERVSLAKGAFKARDERPPSKSDRTPTAAGLFTNSKNDTKCLFCKDSDHWSVECTVSMKLDRKMEILRDRNCCFKCLGYGHIAKACKRFVQCTACKRQHYKVLCPREDTSVREKEDAISVNTCNSSFVDSNRVYLQTLCVYICNSNNVFKVRALLDSGAQRSYIKSSLIQKLALESVGSENLSHVLFGGHMTNPEVHRKFKILLKGVVGVFKCYIKVLEQESICHALPHVPASLSLQLQERGISLTDVDDGDIELLIGADALGALLTGNQVHVNEGLYATETRLGWTLMGKSIHFPTPSCENAFIVNGMLVQTSIPKIADLWSLDVIGITDPLESKTDAELIKAVKEHFLSTLSQDDSGRYIVRMPWIENHPPLPTNFSLAKKRLDRTIKTLQNNNLKEAYGDVFHTWLKEGIIVEEKNVDHHKGHYLPHRAVLKENSTTKIRPVFDASAKEYSHPSLNDCLSKGENLIEKIPSILHKFRMGGYAVVSDIAKAFLQIKLHESDQQCLKFLWKNTEGQLTVYKHCRVVFGVSCSPFLLCAVLNFHLESRINSVNVPYDIENLRILKESLYVDNCLTSMSSEVKLKGFIRDSIEVLAEAQFNLRGWESNLDPIADDQKCDTAVLGMVWNRKDDTLSIDDSFLDAMENPSIITKRVILSKAHKVFDIIGYCCPVMVIPKMLLQELWERKISWDQKVPEEFEEKFYKWYKDLKYLQMIRIPRWIIGYDSPIESSLHLFCDASSAAYAAVIFQRSVFAHGVTLRLVAARARVLPKKKLTIPRAELLAATIGVRLRHSIQRCEEIPCVHWTDSTTVLSWIFNNDNWGVYVANRVKEIRSSTFENDNWRHVPGSMNPADLPSRGCLGKKLLDSRWWEGPKWLLQPPDTWPDMDFVVNHDEVNSEKRSTIVSSMFQGTVSDWYHKDFSTFNKIQRVVGWVVRFVNNCRGRVNKSKVLECDELKHAENLIWKWVQSECFSGKDAEILRNLNPIVDQAGLIRLKTKISERDDLNEFRHPTVLPKNHPVVVKLINEVHQKSLHAGLTTIMNILREKYWVLGGRQFIKSVVNKCVRCKRFASKRMETPLVPLPKNRVRDAKVFEIVGVDLAGPLYLRKDKKAWICIFTCAVYRAVHLELLSSLSTEGFLLGLRRFISRRDRPATIYSDNGTNFAGCAKLFKAIDWEQIQKSSASKEIKWIFNPPSAAWWGGWWERLIRILKDLLKRVLGKAHLNFEEMTTILCECETVMNARPLTYLSDSTDQLVALSPRLYLQEVAEVGDPDLDQIDGMYLSKRALYRQTLRDELRKRFRQEYLGALKYHHVKGKHFINIKKGDIVLVDDGSKRLNWPLGMVQDVIAGKDGHVRVVKVKMAKGELVRPVQRIYRLEMSNDYQETLEVPGSSESIPKDVVTRMGRSVRMPSRYLD